MADDIIYREFHVVGRLAIATAGLGVALFVAFFFVGPPVGGLLLLAAIFSIFPAMHLAGVYAASRIVLTPRRLRIGSETFGPADFDFVFGVQPSLVLAPTEQTELESRFKLSDQDEFRVAGGSWGRTIGTEMMVLREADSECLVAVFTRRPEILDPLLTQWIEEITESRS